MEKTFTAVMPQRARTRREPNHDREQMRDTTLGAFKRNLQTLLEAIDGEDEQLPVRMLIERKYRYNAISCWTGEAFITFTIDKDRRF